MNHKKSKVYGGNNLFILYLSKSVQPVTDTLAPRHLQGLIQKHLDWYVETMRPVSGRLVRLLKSNTDKEQI